jgi:phosphopantothenoylcysteine decarboxylase / phosphopantothenate---cysteine ligase
MTDPLAEKRIILGVTGSIAAYKTADLLRQLLARGAEVQVVMTEAAKRFITPDTLRTLSGKPVLCDMFAEPLHWKVEHVALADWAQLVLIAPATATTMARLASGLADDLLCCLTLSTRTPILIAPAMDEGMFNHTATQANLARLRELGYTVLETGTGELASGKIGKGRLIALEDIICAAERLLVDRDLTGRKIVITAGPTQEAIDEVRFISNRSSGKMGYALANAAARRGAQVVLISGPTALAAPYGLEVQTVETAGQMYDTALAAAPGADVFIGAAAVADFTPEEKTPGKIKRREPRTLKLVPTTDVIAAVGALKKKRPKVVVAFAAETERLVEHAKEKLATKHADLAIANDIRQPGGVFGTEDNQVAFVFADGEVRNLPRMTKAVLADEILDAVRTILESR